MTKVPGAKDFLALPFWLGLLAGVLEACQNWAFRNNLQILMIHKVPADIFWIAPLVYIAVLLLPALGFLALSRFWARRSSWCFDACVFVCGLLATYSQVRLTGKIHHIGVYVFALGAAVSLVRGLRARPDLLPKLRWVAAACPPILLGIGLATAAFHSGEESSMVSGRPVAVNKGPNFLILLLDTVRADHMSTYGYGRNTTPEIDRWAQRGVVFENAWSTSSWTLPAHASLLTGLEPYQHGAGSVSTLSTKFQVLTEFLRAKGYRTGAFIANDLFVSPEYGFSRGFERFRVYTHWSVASRTFYGYRLYLLLTEKLNYTNLPVRRHAPQISNELLSWVNEDSSGTPFFALVNYFDAHAPYYPPPPFDKKFQGEMPGGTSEDLKKRADIVNPYDGLVGFLDWEVGRVLQELDSKKILENTVVMITSDHGEALGNHDRAGHGDSLYREVGRVPLIIFGPGVLPGIRQKGAVSLRRIPATIAWLAGDQSGNISFPGPTLAAQLQGDRENETDDWVLLELSRETGGYIKSLVNGKWHYIWDVNSGKEEIYDMDKDPAEKSNLAGSAEAAPQLQTMRARLISIFPDLPIGKPGG